MCKYVSFRGEYGRLFTGGGWVPHVKKFVATQRSNNDHSVGS